MEKEEGKKEDQEGLEKYKDKNNYLDIHLIRKKKY